MADNETKEIKVRKGFHPVKWVKSRFDNIIEEKYLGKIIITHIVLILLHVMQTMQSEIHYHADLRVAGCALIIFLSFLFGRKGFVVL